MGRKSNSRKPPNIRGIMRGVKNRWGRFQCPRDGSICKSLEAWQWHRVKYHPTENINFVELGDDEEDGRTENRKSSHLSSGLPSVAVPTLPPHRPISPSSRLLPPEAFAPLRQEVVFPDDVSDLTEPEIPVLLSEETMASLEGNCDEKVGRSPKSQKKETDGTFNQNEGGRQWEPIGCQETAPESRNQEDIRDSLSQEAVHCSSDQESVRDSHRSSQLQDSRSQERFRNSRFLEPSCTGSEGNGCHGNHRPLSDCDQAVAGGNAESALPRCLQSSVFKMISQSVMELMEGGKRLAMEDVLPKVESHFSGLGVMHETLVGVVTGTLMGAMEQWKHGYEAGWRDGVKEVLRAPFLSSLSLPRHSLDVTMSPESTKCDALIKPAHLECTQAERQFMTSGGHRRNDALDTRDVIRLSAEKSRDRDDGSVETPSERTLNYQAEEHGQSSDDNNNTTVGIWR